MIEGMKARRRMAMYVALGLSAGSTALFHGGTAYAAETHDYTETAATVSGLEGTDETGFMSDNRIVLGTEGGPTNRPSNTFGIFSGGGKKNATADVSNNTITIHGLYASNGGGYSMVYGGISGTGAVTGNKVIFNHGETADALVGGYTNATDKDVRGNSVSVADGTIKDDIIGGWAGRASSTGTLEGNTVTITGGTLGSYSDGIVYGARTSGNGVLTNNHVSFANATSRKALYGAATDDPNSAAALRGNGVTVTSGTINSSVEGGRSVGTGDVTGNTVSISGGSALSLIGGYASNTGNATGNVVTVTGGTVTGGITGGYAAGTGRTTGNTVNLGDGTHTDLTGAVLSGSDVSGGSKADDITDNTLNVAAKNIHVKSLHNFDTYNFKLNNAFANGDTMLSVTDAGAFSGTGVDWTKINADLSGISADYINNIHGVHRVTLLKSAGTDDLHFNNYADRSFAATDTHESGLVTDTDEATAKSVEWVVNRFKDGRVIYDGTAATGYESIYGGISYEGHTTTGNQLTVTGVYSTDEPKYAYGGRNEGTTGDVTRNAVTIDLAHAADLVEEVYGGMASAEDNTGAVDHNTANMKNGSTRLLYGGYTFGKGAVTNNEVQFDGGTSTGYVAGGYLDNTASTAEMMGNKVVFTNGTAAEIVGADSHGKGKLSGNTVTFGGAGSVAEILRGALAENQAVVEGNAATMTGGSAERVYGGTTYATNPATGDLVAGTGNALNNTVTIGGGAVTKEIMGGIGYHADGNVVTITGGTIGTTAQAADVYGGWVAGPGSSTTGNTVNLGAVDGTYTADLTNAQVHGDNSTDSAVNNNVLNVRGKDITVKSVDTFDKYNFKLKGNIGGGDTMLTLANGGFGRDIDWNNVTVDLTGQTGNPNGTITLLRTNTANALKFKNYDVRDLVNDPNADYEAFLRTDTDKVAGQSTHEASAVTLSTGRFRKSSWTYDGTNPVTNDEVAGGVSRRDGHTAEGNTLTITSVAPTGLNAAYGGEAKSASDVRNNHVIVEGTGSGTIANVFGGATGKADGAAENNHVRITSGMVTNAMGGSVSGANASATGNDVTIAGGTVANVIGAGGAVGAGNVTGNHVIIEGGTVTGQIVGGYTRALTSRSNGNTVTLGGGTLTGTEVWGTSYVNASNQAAVLGSSDAQIAGNTLSVTAKDLTVKKVRNFEKYTFKPTAAVQNGDTMLTLSAAGGFGELSSDGSAVKVKWSDVTADPSALLAGGAGLQGKNSITLLKTADGAADLHFDSYAATAKADGTYETILRTDGDASDTAAILLDVNRYKGGHVTTDQDADSDLYGGYSASDHTNAGQTIGHTTSGNTLSVTRIASGKNINAYGGYTGGTAGGAENNELTVNVTAAGAGTINNAYGGYTKGAGAVKGNQLTFSQGATLGDLIGGYADSAAHAAEVTGNTVTVTGGSVGGLVYGGRSDGTGKVERNTVTLRKVTVGGDVVGGYSDTTPAADTAVTNGNTVNLYGTTVNATVFGGAVKNSANVKVGNGKDNTLAIHAAGTKIADFAGVQNLRFYVPEERTAADTTPMLTLTANVDKDIRGLSIGVGIAGEHSVLAKGDTISLLKIAAGHTLTTDADLRNDVTGMQGVSMRYRFGLEKQGNDELIATVRDTEINPQTKSLVETRVAAAALINGGADLLAESGMNAAISAGNTADQGMGAQAAANDHTYHLWAAQSGSALRLNSGSHIDAKGWNLNLGFARQKAAERSILTYGPFVEYGHGSYDSYLDDGTHGDGASSYIGAGIMAKSVTENGSYIEGSVRVGRTKSDYTGSIAGQSAGYDMSSTYYGAHIGVGQKKELTGGTLETYAKYFYAHQSGGSERLTTGDLYDFDAVDSHRLRIGTRWTKENGAGEFYTGLAYEYEFGSDARASYAGYGTPTPTLKGSTGIFELGYRFARPDSNVSYGLNLTGMMGKRRGITGSMQVNWAL